LEGRASASAIERKAAMKPFHEIGADAAAGIRYILFDIDDTITTHGKVTARAFDALWRLHDAGYYSIPVTGRPAGWCDAIIRQWPVQAIVGENGAFAYYFEKDQLRSFTHPSVASGDYREKLDAVRNTALQGVPGCRVAKDQFCRIYDLAIDFNEDPPHLGLEAAEEIRRLCVSMGAEAKVSSIHVNAWFGKYDKLSMTLLFMDQILNEKHPRESVMFFGDSPNDEPMFAYFPVSCGVANVRPFVSAMKHLPAYVAAHESGLGFAEAVDHFLSLTDSGTSR
jgi:HAD superfamily hydrolase (TIGR01484 family)